MRVEDPLKLEEIFDTDVKEGDICDWYDRTPENIMWIQVIELLLSRFENLQKQIDDLKKSPDQLPVDPHIKIGWVYKNREDKEILILKINDEVEYPLKGVLLSHPSNTSSYLSDGCYRKDGADSNRDLILSTGRKWEIEE